MPGALALVVLLAAPVPKAPADEAVLRDLHAKVVRAHLERRVALLMEDEAADSVVAGRGEITRPTLDERRARFTTYFRDTAFTEYRDLVEPLVHVSADGTLGWVMVQVRALGTRSDGGPVDFTSAWIELYEKRAGRWWRVGNVSNFKP